MAAQRNATTRNYLRVRGEDGGGSPVQGTPGNYLRVRGEYTQNSSLTNHTWELPPRARRIQVLIVPKPLILGTTSACAENTPLGLNAIEHARNYLRVRGEYPAAFVKLTLTVELPPRARRIRDIHRREAPCTGTTSACAENTL